MKTNNRTDAAILEFVSKFQENKYDWIDSVTYSDFEDYGIDLTLKTKSGKIVKEEVKSSRNQPIKKNGYWNNYFSLCNVTNGMYRMCNYADCPKKEESIEEIKSKGYKMSKFTESIPGSELLCKHVYVLNASALNRMTGEQEVMASNCKFVQMKNENGLLIYVAKDGMLIWKNIDDALLGYMWMRCKHTNDFKNQTVGWELKAIMDMEKAVYIEFNDEQRKQIREIL